MPSHTVRCSLLPFKRLATLIISTKTGRAVTERDLHSWRQDGANGRRLKSRRFNGTWCSSLKDVAEYLKDSDVP